MSIFEQVSFKAPNYSVYNLSHDNKLTYPIGKVVPVLHADVAPGERFRCSIEQLTRFVPLLSPVMHNFRLYVDSLFVPYRILGEDYENAFNYAKDENSHPIPHKDFEALSSKFQYGKLYDYLGFPTFEKLRDIFIKALNSQIYPGKISFVKLVDGDLSSVPYDSNHLSWLSIPVNEDECRVLYGLKVTDAEADNEYFPTLLFDGSFSHVFDGVGSSVDLGPNSVALGDFPEDASHVYFRPFFGWFVVTKLKEYGDDDFYTEYVSLLNSGKDAFGELCTRFDLVPDAVVSEYINYVFNELLGTNGSGAATVEVTDDSGTMTSENLLYHYLPFIESSIPCNGLEFKTYWKAIFDWYINTNIDGDGEDLYQNFLDWYNDKQGTTPSFDFTKPFTRRWESDYFTSCFPDGMIPNVAIPANPTVIDIRAANKAQKLEERTLYAGKRPQDQNLAHFGVVSSNARFDRTEVLSRQIFDIDINAISQTNQSEWNKALRSPLGSYAGQGTSIDLGRHLFDYTAEERGMLLVFVSVRPVSSYFQGLPKQATKISRFDFLTPILADVSEAIVKRRELYCDVGLTDAEEVFGYNRQYAEYMFMPNETHSEFKRSLRHWTGSRYLPVDRAYLDKDFIGVEPGPEGDDINRVFATGSGDTILQYLYFHLSAARPLSRFVNYSL